MMRVFISVCEPSADRLGASLIHAWASINPTIMFEGTPGPMMQQAGCVNVLKPFSPVMGIFEVLKKMPIVLLHQRRLWRYLLKHPPDVFIGIDSSSFHLSLEKKIRKKIKKTCIVHYHGPSIWAYAPWRIRNMHMHLLLVLFPFELSIYRNAPFRSVYVGHPILERLRHKAPALSFSLDRSVYSAVIVLMPGSRSQEIQNIAPVLLQAACQYQARHPETQFLMPVAQAQHIDILTLMKNRIAPHLPLRITTDSAWSCLSVAQGAWVKSGTSTLEALWMNVPMVIVYRTHPLTYEIGKRMLNVQYIGLPNILAQKNMVPELIQHNCTPTSIIHAFEHLNIPDLLENYARVQQTMTVSHMPSVYAALEIERFFFESSVDSKKR